MIIITNILILKKMKTKKFKIQATTNQQDLIILSCDKLKEAIHIYDMFKGLYNHFKKIELYYKDNRIGLYIRK